MIWPLAVLCALPATRLRYLRPGLAVILAAVAAPQSIVPRLLSVAPVRYVGRISYGLYIYAFPLQQVLAAHGHLTFLTALAATAPLALASWLLVEKPALQLKPAT